jgi:hypothetical protein
VWRSGFDAPYMSKKAHLYFKPLWRVKPPEESIYVA